MDKKRKKRNSRRSSSYKSYNNYLPNINNEDIAPKQELSTFAFAIINEDMIFKTIIDVVNKDGPNYVA